MCRFLSLVLFVLVAAPLAAQPPGAAVRGIVRDAVRGAGRRGQSVGDPPRDQPHPQRRDRRRWPVRGQRPAARAVPARGDPRGIQVPHRGVRAVCQPGPPVGCGPAGRRAVRAGRRHGIVDCARARLDGRWHDRRERAGREPAARRPQLPRAGAAGARHDAGGPGIGQFGARRFCVHRGRWPRGRQRLPSRRRGQRRSEAELPGCPAAG